MDCFSQWGNNSIDQRPTENGDEDRDIISKLPNGILHSIISFLPTKDVICISALSRRWEDLWTSLSNLDLDDCNSGLIKKCKDHPNWTIFLNFVDRVLKLHDDSDIKRFRLRFYKSADASRINSWVSAALKHNCNELDLSLPEGIYVLPCCLFTCQSLVVLKIHIKFSPFKVPTSVYLPSLKCLHLSSLTIETNWSNLFSNCLVLEELQLRTCVWQKIKCFTILNPSLKSLTISLVKAEEPEGELRIYATGLTSFTIISLSMINLSLLDAPSLVDVYMWHPGWLEANARRAFNLLAQVHHVKSLKIHEKTIVLVCGAEKFLVQLPVFQNLTYLQVTSDLICCTTTKLLVASMQKTPNLESLFVQTMNSGTLKPVEDDDEYNLEVVPCLLHTKLKTFEIKWFTGAKSEMHLIKYVLQNAVVLELVRIVYNLHYKTPDELEKIESTRREIELLPRRSKKCQILIVI